MDFTNVTKALTARGFKVSSFETAKEAAEYLNSQIDGATVGFGGSITLEELGLYALLSGHNTVFSHWHLPEGGDATALRAQAAGSEHYLLSANGIAETGEIINIDGAPAISPRRRTRSVSTQRRPARSRLTIATTARVPAASAVRSPCSGAR